MAWWLLRAVVAASCDTVLDTDNGLSARFRHLLADPWTDLRRLDA
jgi:hypothetical protein